MLINNDDYFEVLNEIKSEIRKAQYYAVVSANRVMIMLYWNTGKHINTHKSWGNKFIETLSMIYEWNFLTSPVFLFAI